MRVLARSICALSLCFPFVVSAANAAQDDWYTYRHDSQRTAPNRLQAIFPIRPGSAVFMS